MKTKPAKKTNAVSVICFILAVIFFLYGIYMVLSAVDYIRSYESTGLINTQNVLQYVVTSSASYFGFAFLFFAAGYAIRMLVQMKPAFTGVITETTEETALPETPEFTEDPASEASDAPEAAPDAAEILSASENLSAKETPDAFEENDSDASAEVTADSMTEETAEDVHVPEIGDTSSALTFHELIIDPTEENEEAISEEPEPLEDDAELVEEVSLEDPAPEGSETAEPDETPAGSQPEQNKPVEKISSSMIRDIFEHK